MKSRISGFCLTIITSMATTLAFASDQGAHGSHSSSLDQETLQVVIYQAINVAALVAGLIFFLRGTVKKFFIAKKESFVEAAEKVQAARIAAEEEHVQIKIKLS